MKNKILIIGHQGMLGQDLKKVFPQAVCLDRKDLDVTNKTAVQDIFYKIKPNIVINATAYNNVNDCETDEGFMQAKKINSIAVQNMAKNCLLINAIFIHYSTNYIFSGQNQNGYQEDDVPTPINRYGESKLLGEQAILKTSKLKYYIIRTSKLFGQKGRSSAAKNSFFDIMISLAKKRHDIKVVNEEVSNFTYTQDLAQATKELIIKKYKYGIYHIINENPCTWYQGATTMFDMLNMNVKLMAVNPDYFPRPAQRPKYGILLNTKFPKLRKYEKALAEYL